MREGNPLESVDWGHLLRRSSWAAHLAVIGLSAAFLGSGTGSLISLSLPERSASPRPVPNAKVSKRASREDRASARRSADAICTLNVFEYSQRPCVDDLAASTEPSDDEEGDRPLNLCKGGPQLVGTVTSKTNGWSFAMIEAGDEIKPYRVGDEVAELGEVERIGWRLVLMDRPAEPDCLLDVFAERAKRRSKRRRPRARPRKSAPRRHGRLDRETQAAIDKGIQEVSPTERNVDRSLVEKLMDNPTALMRSVRVRPNMEGGQVTGFRLLRIRRNSLLGKLGLRNGDIVRSVNSIDITSADRALAAYTKLRNEDRLTLSVTRHNRTISLDFNIR